MNIPKLRNTLVLLHLYFAAFMAPAFLLVALSGGLYLLGNSGKVETTALALPAEASLDFTSPTLEDDVRGLLSAANIDHDFEYIRNRGTLIQLRPTSRTYLSFTQTPDGLTAERHEPDLQYSMLELHKGHGPSLFKTYQKLVALTLFGVIFGGLTVGLLAKAYRRKTVIALTIGTVVFFILALLA